MKAMVQKVSPWSRSLIICHVICAAVATKIAIINGYICVQDDDLRKAEILSIKQRKDGLAF